MPLAMPVLGEMAPDAALPAAPDGDMVRLATLFGVGPVVLVFLRHPGCPFCREMLGALRRAEADLARRGATVVAVLPAEPAAAPDACRTRIPHFVCLADPKGHAFDLYGLGRGSLTAVAGPAVLLAGLRVALRGHLPGLPRGDTFRLGGVFIVGRDGRLRYVHRARHAADNPSVARLIAVLDGLGPVRPRDGD